MSSLEERFWSKVDASGDCWEWTASKRRGYGQIKIGGRPIGAHRVSYELTTGPIPEGMQIDHMCHNTSCVKPAHLRAVTPKQNGEHRQGAQVNSTTGLRGVYWIPSRQCWRAQAAHNGHVVYAGHFANKGDAEAAVVELRNRLHTHNDADRRDS